MNIIESLNLLDKWYKKFNESPPKEKSAIVFILLIIFVVVFVLNSAGELVKGVFDSVSSSDKHQSFAEKPIDSTTIKTSDNVIAGKENISVYASDNGTFNFATRDINIFNGITPEQYEAGLKRNEQETHQETDSPKPSVIQGHGSSSLLNNKKNNTLNSKDNYVEKELFDKNLLKDLHNATYNLSNTDGDVENALQLYRGVLDQLSTDARNALDQKLLISANKDFQEGRNSDSIKKYQLIFQDYLIEPAHKEKLIPELLSPLVVEMTKDGKPHKPIYINGSH